MKTNHNIHTMRFLKYIISALAALPMLTSLVACEDNKSYSDLLREEEKATNWYMANQRIELQVPEDSVLQYGEDAPYYKLDDDGYIYMQVINPGDSVRAKKNDMVYFRFKRLNLKYLYSGTATAWEGNADNMNSSLGATYFIYDDMLMVQSMTYGQGVQWPLRFVRYNSEVNLVLRSYYGFQTDQSQCLVYIYNIKYFKSDY